MIYVRVDYSGDELAAGIRKASRAAETILATQVLKDVRKLMPARTKSLINRSHVVVTGPTDEIRKKYGDNQVELVYSDAEGRHSEVIDVAGDPNAALREALERGVTIHSWRELIPRMNDIFIKLVTEKE